MVIIVINMVVLMGKGDRFYSVGVKMELSGV